MARLEESLGIGEELIICERGYHGISVLTAVLLGITPGILYVLGWLLAPSLLEYPWDVALGILAVLLLMFPLDFFLLNRWFDRWRVAVTDRRIILRGGLFGLHRDELQLSEIDDVRHECRKCRLILAAGNHTLAIRCRNDGAARILESLLKARNGGP